MKPKFTKLCAYVRPLCACGCGLQVETWRSPRAIYRKACGYRIAYETRRKILAERREAISKRLIADN